MTTQSINTSAASSGVRCGGCVYYNEIDPRAADWLEALIAEGLIPKGFVDRRSITDVKPEDLNGFAQCHFFAGIGGWPYALQLAGWPADREVWTGSCPCQPLSCAGQRKGHADERHLWPAFYHLIAERKPATVFGEQVASPDGLEWLTGVRADMEAAGYAFGAADLCAASVGAPHIRQRLYWVGDAFGSGLEGHAWHGDAARDAQTIRPDATSSSGSSISPGLDAMPVLQRMDVRNPRGARPRLSMSTDRGMGSRPVWAECDALACSDGWRRVRSGTFPMAHGLSARVGRLRGYGNAIVPQVAAEFICAYLETEQVTA